MPVNGFSRGAGGERALLLGAVDCTDTSDDEDITVAVGQGVSGTTTTTADLISLTSTASPTSTSTCSLSSTATASPPPHYLTNSLKHHNNNNNNNNNNKMNPRPPSGRKAATSSPRLGRSKGKTKPKPLKTKVFTTKFSASPWHGCVIRRKHFVGILALALLLLYLNYMIVGDDRSEDKVPVTHYSHVPGMKGYLVWSDRCKMPNMDPYLPEVMQHFKRQKYKSCSSAPPLTRLTFNATSQLYTLQVNDYAVHDYSKSGLTDCCYQRILRNANGTHADKDVNFAECVRFKGSTVLAPTVDHLIVKCFYKKKQVYLHGHAAMPARPEIRARLAQGHEQGGQRPPSVLLIGIDSISRNNLIRAMPKTAQYLYDNEWFEMSGYNKIDDNTFPNLMAILTGLNYTAAVQKCSPTRQNGLAQCTFIWDLFREHGYVTAYGEDEASINTFNYGKLGFEHPPVDYYLRPFLLGAEKCMRVQRKTGLSYCLGLLHSADYVYDYAVELARRYHDQPYFGLFWTNTFSHNAISDPSSMDERILDYLKAFATLGTLNNTIVAFFSDHGIRFGPTRKTLSGHLEERLPFMFLWLPPPLKTSHPEFVNALSVNKNRLTNPYDLHMTLKMMLQLTGRGNRSAELEEPAAGCPRCQTLLRPVPHNRSCTDIAIEDHWCTCIPYQSVYKRSAKVQKLARRIVDYMNDFVATYHNGSVADKCVHLYLGSVDNAYRAQMFSADGNASASETQETYRILLYTKPNNGLFEATVRYTDATDAFEVTGQISRLNMYSSDSSCVDDGAAKKYCSCRRKLF